MSIIICEKCDKVFNSLGYARHRAMHRNNKRILNNNTFIEIKGTMFKNLGQNENGLWIFKDLDLNTEHTLTENIAMKHFRNYKRKNRSAFSS